jgi:hypothetical protein
VCSVVTAGILSSTENAELVLQADNVDVADVEEIRRSQIGREILFFNLEANHLRIFVAAFDIVHRHHQTLALWVGSCDGSKQVGGERGNSALAGQVVAHEGDLSNFGRLFQVILSARTMNRSGAEPTK